MQSGGASIYEKNIKLMELVILKGYLEKIFGLEIVVNSILVKIQI
jgi:hypothetical protein